MTEQEEKQGLAFLEGLAETGGYKLRPVAYDTINRIQLLELSLGGGDKAAWLAMDDDARLDEIHAYLFIQAAPLSESASAIRAFRRRKKQAGREAAFEEFMCGVVEPFLSRLAPAVKQQLAEQLTDWDQIEASRVVTEPPPGAKSGPPDPNFESRAGSPRA